MRKRYRMAAALLLMAAIGLAAAGCEKSGEDRTQEAEQEVVLTALVRQPGVNVTGTWTGEGAEKLYEDTGIRLEFYSNGSGDERKLKQYLAAGTLPDLIGFRDLEQAELLMGADVLLDLNGYETELPGIFKTAQYDTAVKYYRTYYGGQEEGLYFLPTSVGHRDEKEYNRMPMVQWNVYKNAGYPRIGTLEDYLDAAAAMQEIKPMTALGKQVYGFSLCGEWEETNLQQPSALSYFYGIDTGTVSPLLEMDAESEGLSLVTEENSFYKRALRFYFEANQRGLLDPDSRTQTYESLEKKYKTGQILFSNDYRLTGDDSSDDKTETDDGTADGYTALPADDMRIYKEPDNAVGEGWFFAVNKNSRNTEKTCELLNWLYMPETIAYLYSSEEDAGNVFQYLGLNETGKEADESSSLEKEVRQWRGGTLTQQLKQNSQIQEGSRAVYMVDPLPVGLKEKNSGVEELIREISWEMIYAEDETQFESLWQEMRAQSEVLGIGEIEAYYQKAWQTALEREKLYGAYEE